MKASSLRKVLFAVLLVSLALPAVAHAAKYHVYRQGGASSKYTTAAYFNSTHRKIVTISMSGKCDDASRVSLSDTNVKASKSGKFSGETDFNIYLYSTQTNYNAKAKFTGTVKKRKYVKVSFEITTDAPGCGSLSHSFKAKYKGTQSGG